MVYHDITEITESGIKCYNPNCCKATHFEMKLWLYERGGLFWEGQFCSIFLSKHLKSHVIRGASFGGSGLIRGASYDGSGLIRGASFGGSGLIRGASFGGSGLIRGASFGGSGLIRGAFFGGSGLIRGASFCGRGLIRGASFCGSGNNLVTIIYDFYIFNLVVIFLFL